MAWKDSGKYSGLRDIRNIRGNLDLESFEKRVFPGKKKKSLIIKNILGSVVEIWLWTKYYMIYGIITNYMECCNLTLVMYGFVWVCMYEESCWRIWLWNILVWVL